MVLLHFKLGEKNQFIIETTTNTPITEILKKGIEVNNLRCKIDTLCMVIEELMKHGPLKTEETRGLKETENLDENIEPKYRAKKTPMPPKVGTKYNEDKTNQKYVRNTRYGTNPSTNTPKTTQRWELNIMKIKQIKEQVGY